MRLESVLRLMCACSVPSRSSRGRTIPARSNLTTCIDRPQHLWKDQTFFCHLRCLQSRAMTDSGNFYIAETDFATRGEIEAERQEHGDT